MRVKLSILLLLLISNRANSQIIIDGPKTAKQKESIALTIKPNGTNDLKINVFPENTSWRLARNYEDPTIVEINFTPTQDAVYYFLVSGNKDQKTEVAKWVVGVGVIPVPVPVPDVIPIPKPAINPYADKIKAAYLVSPDAENKPKLAKVYQTVADSTYASWATCHADLVKQIDDANLKDKLQGVKDQAVEFLTADTKDVPYSQALKTKIFKQLADALKE